MSTELIQPWQRLIKCGPGDNEEITQAGALARDIEDKRRRRNKHKIESSSLADGINEQRRQLFHRMGIR